MAKMKQGEQAAAIEEDPLLQGLVKAKGRRIEVIAFGISYVGTLESVDPDQGTVVLTDGDDRAVIEIERIESLSLLSV
ncbi:MAG: hypothetical protein HY465_03635 [Deltaproteobacteria bacterium]|nr:hypothetical protein [Deltaproteobacteria bacterium]